MSLKASCSSLGSLLAGRAAKRPKSEDGRQLQEAALHSSDQNQNLCSSFQESENPDPRSGFCSQNQSASDADLRHVPDQLSVEESRRRADQRGVSVDAVSVKMMSDRSMDVTGGPEDGRRRMLTPSQRVQLCVSMESSKRLLSYGAFCPKSSWAEYRRRQKHPNSESIYFSHRYDISTSDFSVKSDDDDVQSWSPGQSKALCSWTCPQEDEDTRQVQQRVLSTVVRVSVAAEKTSVSDEMLLWLSDTTEEERGDGAQRWIQTLDASLCGASVSPETSRRFFTHCLTQIFTHNPRLAVSDAVALQNEWTVAKAGRCLTSLCCQSAAIFSVEQLLSHSQQVLETHEVNWKHVSVFVSSSSVYNQSAQFSLKDLLSRMSSSAFEGYDSEKSITAFSSARQGALEGAGVFPSYSDWFKMSFAGCSAFHACSKKSSVFSSKFLSDSVPFEPPQYSKVHILYPPYVPTKHRGSSMEYVTSAKTRSADLRESVEDMGLYEDAAAASAQPHSQAAQDVDKAVSSFDSTGRISATVMEASIFRRPYFLTRFLPASSKPRALPSKPDARMNFIEASKKADKIPAAQYSSYVETCQKQRQQNVTAERSDDTEDPVDVLQTQSQQFSESLVGGHDGETSVHSSRVSHTSSVIFPPSSDESERRAAVTVNTDAPWSQQLHSKVVDLISQNFCQCSSKTSQRNPPNKQSFWASRFVCMSSDNRQSSSCLVYRSWRMFHHQGAALAAAHILGSAAFSVHFQANMSVCPSVSLVPSVQTQPEPLVEASSSAMLCNNGSNMIFSLRLCAAAVSYGLCSAASPQQQQEFIPCSLYKRSLYSVPRSFPEARRTSCSADPDVGQPEDSPGVSWSSITGDQGTWTKTVSHSWRHAAFQQSEQMPEYQLCFSEWSQNELRVKRHEDILSDDQRWQYQQWACWERYSSRPEESGGCGGDTRKSCSGLLHAVMDQPLSDPISENTSRSKGFYGTGTCLPDSSSRLQESMYESLTNQSGSDGCREELWDFVSQRCSSAPVSIASKLDSQQTLHGWNRVSPALPAAMFFNIKTEGGRTSVDCRRLVEHINQQQRKVCCPSSVSPCSVTAHSSKGLSYAAVQCGRPAAEVNQVWSSIQTACPLLAVSAVRWWQQSEPVSVSLWTRLRPAELLPEPSRLVSACRRWARSSTRGRAVQTCPAAVSIRAASSHEAFRRCEEPQQNLRDVSESSSAETEHQQVSVSSLFLCMKDFLSTLSDPQDKSSERSRYSCSELSAAVATSADWSSLFGSNAPSEPNPVTSTSSDDCVRLMPWAVCSLSQQQSAGFSQRASCLPGFLHSAVSWYSSVSQSFSDGATPPAASEQQVEPSHLLSNTKHFVSSLVSQAPPAASSSIQLTQSERQCADSDPESAAALCVHSEPLSPESDFL